MRLYYWLIGLLALGLRAVTPSALKLPAVVKFNEHPFAERCYGKVIAGGDGGSPVVAMLRAILGLFTPRRLAFVAIAVLLFTLMRDDGTSAGTLLANVAVLLPAEVAKKKADYDKVAGEALKIQEQYKGKPMPQNVGDEYQAKCQEAEALWAEVEPHFKAAEERVANEQKLAERRSREAALVAAGRTVASPTMPAESQEESKNGVAGYMTFSDFVVMSAAYQEAAKGGFRQPAQLGAIKIGFARAAKSRLRGPNGEVLIALTHEERKAFESRPETKALVTIGSGVIEPQRLAVVPQVTADTAPRMRDVVPVGQTQSNAVSYIREESFTRAAAETAAGSAKPEASLEYTEQTANVRDIPVWIPVTTAQLSDWPGLRGRIDNRLLYDIAKREAEQMVYGNGSGQNLEGLLDVSGTQDISASAKYNGSNDRLEHIRLGATLVKTAGYDPGALLIHPEDWFDVIVLKGTDKHYLGQVFMTADRELRVWGLTVVEMMEMEARAGVATEARNLIVADLLRACELLDREQASVQVGLNSDDFTKNRRTILAEERVAFPIYAPAAVAYLETRASAT